jgi:hypothetical protein
MKYKKTLIGCALVVLLSAGVGLFTDAFDGFEVLRNSKSILQGIAGVFLLGLSYLLSELAFGWLDSKYKIGDVFVKVIVIAIIIIILAFLMFCVFIVADSF